MALSKILGAKPSAKKSGAKKAAAKAAPKKAVPKKEVPKKPAKKAEVPKKAEPKKAEPKKAVPKKAEPKKAAAPKKAEPKKAVPKKAVPKKAKEPTKAQQLKAAAVQEVERPSNALVPTLGGEDIRDLLPPLTDERGNPMDRPDMKRLEKLVTHVTTITNENRARQAVIMYHIEKNGGYKEVGCDTASDFWERRFGHSPSSVKNHTAGIRLLLLLKVSPAKVEKAFALYNYRRLAKFANFAIKSNKQFKEIADDLNKCKLDANMLDKSFDAWLKDSYGAEAGGAEEDDDPNKAVKFPSFDVSKINADTIRAAHDVSCEEERNPKLPIGVTIAKACGLYLGNHGTMFAELPNVINGIEKGYGVKLLVIPAPNSSVKAKSMPVMTAFGCDGRIILHNTKREAAKVFGVPVSQVEEVQIDVTAYLDSIGFNESMQQAEEAGPVHIDQMDTKQLSEHIAKYREELGIDTEEWVNIAADKTLKDQLVYLMNRAADEEMAKAQAAGEEVEIEEIEVEVEGEDASEEPEETEKEEVKPVEVEVKVKRKKVAKAAK